MHSNLLTNTRYCYGLDVPEFIFEDPAIQRIVDLQAELILLLVLCTHYRGALLILQQCQ
jgi:hypothetical protein